MQCGEDDRGGPCPIQQLLTVCASETRLELLAWLARVDSDVSALAAAVDLSAADVSYHLGMMRKAGIVVAHRVGKRRIYRLMGEARYDRNRNQVVMSFKSTDGSDVSVALPLKHRVVVTSGIDGANLRNNCLGNKFAIGLSQDEFKCDEAPSRRDSVR